MFVFLRQFLALFFLFFVLSLEFRDVTEKGLTVLIHLELELIPVEIRCKFSLIGFGHNDLLCYLL